MWTSGGSEPPPCAGRRCRGGRTTSLALLALLAVAACGSEPREEVEVAATCDREQGLRVFSKCATCHPLGETPAAAAVTLGPPGWLPLLPLGPDLRGVVGRPAGAVPDFKYSRALRESGLVWSREQLFRYLEDPLATIPDNRMPFGGLKRSEDREAVVCYLEEVAHE